MTSIHAICENYFPRDQEGKKHMMMQATKESTRYRERRAGDLL